MPLCSEKMTILWYTGLSMHMQVLYLYKNDFPYGLNYFLRMHLTPQIISQILPQKAEDPQGVCVYIYIYYRDCHGMYNSQGLYISSGFILKNKSCISFIGLNSHHGASIPSLQKPGHLRPFSPGWPRAQRRPPAKQCPYGRRSSMSKRILTIKNGV